jgi:hypothetical protein
MQRVKSGIKMARFFLLTEIFFILLLRHRVAQESDRSTNRSPSKNSSDSAVERGNKDHDDASFLQFKRGRETDSYPEFRGKKNLSIRYNLKRNRNRDG